MFKAFTSRFGKSETGEPSARTVEILRHGCAQNVRGSCHLDGRHDSYGTTFLGLQPQKSGGPLLFIDTLTPRVSRAALEEKKTRLSIDFTVTQIPYRGDFLFRRVEKWEGFDALALSVPQELVERQRREYFRVEPKMSAPVHIKIATPMGEEAEVLDISQGGARIRAVEPVPAGEVAEIFLAMPTNPKGWVELKAKVVDSGELPPGVGKPGERRHYIRLQFVNPEPEQTREINQYIVVRQREDLKFLG
ncbi:MAG: PilZ domain-containing protein [Nitrospinae bacterium]|nr:PilZ domain-containing protein [Nitrospinota bacterium]